LLISIGRLLTPDRSGNHPVGWTIRDSLKRIGDARQFTSKVLDAARSLYDHDPFPREIEKHPVKDACHNRECDHELVMTRDRDGLPENRNNVVCEHVLASKAISVPWFQYFPRSLSYAGRCALPIGRTSFSLGKLCPKFGAILYVYEKLLE
jgi:hypothetical protein